jgi:putative aldouronate transport system substrate-binding protein
MSKKSKVISVLLAAAMVATSFAGCSSGGDSASSDAAASTAASETTSTVSGEAKTISWYAVDAAAPADVERINKAASDYLKSKGLNVNLDLHILTWTDYDTQISTMVASHEKFDLLNGIVSTLNSYAQNGGFIEITDDMLNKDAPDIKQVLGDDILALTQMNGKQYVIPVNKDTADYNGYIYNKDVAEKYNIDVSGVKSMKDWTPIFQKLHVADPSIICYLPSTFDVIVNANQMYVNGSSGLCCSIGLSNDSKTVNNYFKLDESKAVYDQLHEWYQAGYLNKDTTADTTALKNAGKVFVYPYALKPGVAAELSTGGTHWGQVEITTAHRSIRNFPGGYATGISASSEDPDLALQVLNLAYKDADFLNMIVFGEKDKDYTLDGKVVTIKENAGYNISDYSWEWGNNFLLYTTELEAKDKWDQMKTFNDSAETLDQTGFWFDTSEYSTITTAIANAFKQYNSQLLSGAVDVDATLKELNSALESSGIDTLLEAMNKSYAEFLASKQK